MSNPDLERRLKSYGHGRWTRRIDIFEEFPEWEENEKKWRKEILYSPEWHECVKKMDEILERISRWDFLVYLLGRTELGSVPSMQVIKRMEAVVSNSLPAITDYFVLYKMWTQICSQSWPALVMIDDLMLGKMKELISGVAVNECPTWFLMLLEDDPAMCPVKTCLDEKVRELKEALSIGDEAC